MPDVLRGDVEFSQAAYSSTERPMVPAMATLLDAAGIGIKTGPRDLRAVAFARFAC